MEKNKKLYPLKFEEGMQILNENSVTANGFLAENTIDDIIDTYLSDVLGESVFKYYKGEFPIEIKWLNLSGFTPLQVCPDDMTARERYMVWGKSKLWYIVDAGPSARIYLGGNKEMNPQHFYDACIQGKMEENLCVFTPRKGDCIFVRPGVVHAAGGGIKLVEISQNSQVTYPLYDISEKKKAIQKPARGKEYKYAMELSEAIDVIDYAPLAKEKCYGEHTTGNKVLADTAHFVVKSLDLTEEIRVFPSLVKSFLVYVCTRGKAHLQTNNREQYSLNEGEMIFIPESMEDFLLIPDEANPHLLEVYLPQLQEDTNDNYLNYDQDESRYPESSGEEEAHEHHHSCECGEDHEEDSGESSSHPGERFFRH